MSEPTERQRLIRALVLELEVTHGGSVYHEDRTAEWDGETLRCYEGQTPILTTPHLAVAAKFLAGVLSE